MKQLLFITALFICTVCHSQYGTLDKTFGSEGKVLGEKYNSCSALALQVDGRIVAGGTGFQEESSTSGFVLFRYLTDGSPDSSFGSSGRVAINFLQYQDETLTDVMVLLDGRILAAGSALALLNGQADSAVLLLARYLPNGRLDSSFGINGLCTEKFFDGGVFPGGMAVQPDGKIVVAGATFRYTIWPNYDYYSFVTRFSPDGVLDKSFGTDNGKTVMKYFDCSINDITFQPDGKILTAGEKSEGGEESQYLIQRYNRDGIPDESFDEDGVAVFAYQHYDDMAYAVHVLPDGKILMGGTVNIFPFDPSLGVLRINGDGTIDNTFGRAGWAVATQKENQVAAASDMVVTSNGNIVLGGYIITDQFQPDEHTDFALAGFTSSGMIDSTFGEQGITTTSFLVGSILSSLALQPDGRIVAGGTSFTSIYGDNPRFALARYLGEGTKQSLVAKVKRFLHNHGITWNGANNVAYYSVEHSTGTSFREVSRVHANTSQQSYDYVIPSSSLSSNTTAATDYYRIRAVSNSGQSNFSNVVSLNTPSGDGGVSIYPNPVLTTLTIKGLNASMKYNITVSDISGTVYLTTTIKQQTTTTFDVSKLKRGNYIINISNNILSSTIKCVKE